jgi:hypothetical protein
MDDKALEKPPPLDPLMDDGAIAVPLLRPLVIVWVAAAAATTTDGAGRRR